MNTLLRSTVVTFLVGLIFSLGYAAYLSFLAFRSHKNHFVYAFRSRKNLNTRESAVLLQANDI